MTTKLSSSQIARELVAQAKSAGKIATTARRIAVQYLLALEYCGEEEAIAFVETAMAISYPKSYTGPAPMGK